MNTSRLSRKTGWRFRMHILRKRFASPDLPSTKCPGSLLYFLHTGNMAETRPCIFYVDKSRSLAGVLIREPSARLRVLLDNTPAEPVFSRFITETDGDGRTVRRFRLFWIALPPGAGELSMRQGSQSTVFLWTNKEIESLALKDMLAPLPSPPRKFSLRLRKILAFLPWVRARYSGCWLLVDRDFRADDNAEHLYRWIMLHHPKQKIFFGLSRQSCDWARLTRDGFRLVDLDGLRYFFAWIHASLLCSSNGANYIRRYDWQRLYQDVHRHQFCFLQHGITHNYQPDFNLHPADILVCATERERAAFVDDTQQPYVFTGREVQLTGFPRHDALLKKAAACVRPRLILIAPTWRTSLTSGRFLSGTGQYPYSAVFRDSAYFRNWQAVLRCEPLREAARQYGYTLCFFPHAYIRQQLQDFDLSGIMLAPDAGGTIQALLAETALFITDYSSTAMEAAYIRRPVLYFQFDRESFSTSQSYKKGYFDYARDGFGDIAVTVHELCTKALQLLKNGPGMGSMYRERAEAFFTLRDGECCRRTYETLRRLSAPGAKSSGYNHL